MLQVMKARLGMLTNGEGVDRCSKLCGRFSGIEQQLSCTCFLCRNHRGLRHYWGLRVKGQHTKTTGRRGKTVGVAKKR